jgi:hypothetical protein
MKLTRYLYNEAQVKYALCVSILHKSDDAIYWAYELYYSGIKKKEFFDLIFYIYYNFFALLNPSFETYLIKKCKELTNKNVKLVSAIIQNFLIRPFNYVVFQTQKIEVEEEKEKLLLCKENPYISKELETTRLISKILGIANQEKKGKNFYVIVQDEEVVQYETIKVNEKIRNYKILKYACICDINICEPLIESIKPQNELTKDEYLYILNYHWLYYASFTPIWKQRIIKYGGIINHELKNVVFPDEDNEEKFRTKYDYEPEEQPLNIKNRLFMH